MKKLEDIVQMINLFRDERDWRKFHSPKNLAMALSVEVAEIVETFQWLTPEESKNLDSERLQHVKDEIADVAIYLLYLADDLDLHLFEAIDEKISKNRLKYPVNR